MSALIFTGGFARKNCYCRQSRRRVRCMQNLQRLICKVLR